MRLGRTWVLVGCLSSLGAADPTPESLAWALRLRAIEAKVEQERQILERGLEESRRLIRALELQRDQGGDETTRTRADRLLDRARAALRQQETQWARLEMQRRRVQEAQPHRQFVLPGVRAWSLNPEVALEVIPAQPGLSGGPSRSGTYQVGDRLRTGEATVTLQTTDGRGQVRMGPHTELQVEEQGYRLHLGTVELAVQNLDAFRKDMTELFQRYGEDLRTLWGADSALWQSAYDQLNKNLEWSVRKALHELRTPIAVLGIRGTRYRVTYRDDRMWVEVEEGQVEIKHARLGDVRLVAAGQCLEVTEVGWDTPSEGRRP